ncbi:hypothetical protein SYN65AY6A5_05190 [Synechococcus sp. 65AY6A5]|uniref:hypothetical protein n=1 Tax=Synechococcus sp. 65AY6A5 TaxID=1353265 RepID=UPI000C180B2C|nr:hypothetical protein [Synechococcus sp. 65AY6A5]PIK88490.1 hypothetical protein SYN65AY6A5_05190 [Synechococcus sp. 65AY6A5]
MSIRLIVESVLQSTYLSRCQESQICHFLQERLYDELDLEAIDRLILALLKGQVQLESEESCAASPNPQARA